MISFKASQTLPHHTLAGFPSILFIAAMTTFVQSFVAIKLAFIALFVFASIADGALRHEFRVYPRLIYFYLALAIIGITWSVVGLLNPAAYFEGVTDALRLYAVWSAAFLFLFTLLRFHSSLQCIHRALVAAGILIALLNFAGILDEVGRFGVIPEFVREELNQKFGFYEGYIQIQSRNIGSMFFLIPYLIAVHIRTDAAEANSVTSKICLALCLILAVVSGRRALLLIVLVTPLTLLAITVLSGNWPLIKVQIRRIVFGYVVAVGLGIGTLAIQPNFQTDIQFLQHVQDAFSATDERTLQKPFLIEGFYGSPIIGQGFGYPVRYQRNEERPWLYELTYYQMLMDAGILGVGALGIVMLVYAAFVINIFRRFKGQSVIPFGLMVGGISLLLGAVSNPYLGSFDLLFFLGFLPFLSTFKRGFIETKVADE